MIMLKTHPFQTAQLAQIVTDFYEIGQQWRLIRTLFADATAF
jgi:hypothetical protein